MVGRFLVAQNRGVCGRFDRSVSAANVNLRPIAVAALTFVSEAFNVHSNNYRGRAESLSRKIDFADSFGWQVRNAEIADTALLLPGEMQDALTADSPDDYFTSQESISWQRAMQNLQESAWYSKNLANQMGTYCLTLTITVAVLSVMALLIGAVIAQMTAQLTVVARVVTASLILVVSAGLIQFTRSYYNFGRKAEAAEREAERLLESTADERVRAVKAFNEYHLARALAPPIPDWLWRLSEERLNKNWTKHVARKR